LIWLIKQLLSYPSLPLFQPLKLHLADESTSSEEWGEYKYNLIEEKEPNNTPVES
jgi:hypothetical protein